MKHLIFCLLTFFFSSIVGFSQGPLYPMPTHYLDIHAGSKEAPISQLTSFRGVRFIDSRADTSLIGYMYFANLGNCYRFNLKDNFAIVNNYLNHIPEKGRPVGKDSLLVVVNDFRIGYARPDDKPEYKRYQALRCRLLLAVKHEDRITVVGNYDTMLLRFGSIESNIKSGLKKILRQANLLAKSQSPDAHSYTETEFMQLAGEGSDRAQLARYPIMQDTCWHNGVYLTYQQFLADAPATITNEPIDSGKIWGYCKGDTVYIRIGLRSYYPLVRSGNQIIVYAPLELGRPVAPVVKMSTGQIIGKVVLVTIALGTLGILAIHNIPAPAISPGGGEVDNDRLALSTPYPDVPLILHQKTYSVWANRLNLSTGQLEF